MQDAFVVRGGVPLRGRLAVSGAKNSALKVLAASLLAPGSSQISNVPDIGDIRVMTEVLQHLGVAVTREEGALAIDVPDEVGCEAPEHLVRLLRASIVVLGPLLARCRRARVAMPGGCNLGNRSIDMHLAGLARMGAHVTYGPDFVEATADTLRGADIELAFPSVGATENLLMAAVRARGRTRIRNAAREPEITDLAAFLRGMGASIHGAGTSEVTVDGVSQLQPTVHRVVPDRIETGTFAVATAVTGGEVVLEHTLSEHLRLPLEKLRSIGVEVDESDGNLMVSAPHDLRATDVVTLPYPGFPTDLQPLFLVLLSQANGTSMLTENVFDGRFSIVEELVRLGADIEVAGHHAIVRGPTRLQGATVRATDLRAGAALVVAGLCAAGRTTVTDSAHVDRGYVDFAGRLRLLGADVHRARSEQVAVGAA
jgi:UDP-N-acetylglucosamine 1-carboxyvinyltransferase